ncbi:MAG: amino acid ABC transporter substrate-binding protein, partial [Caldilineae bacterium]
MGGWLLWRRLEAQSGLAAVQRRGVLRVGLDPSFPPFETLDAGGQVIGLDADIARAIAADLGVQVEFVPIAFDGLYDALQVGRVDVLLSGLPVDPTRTRDVAYSRPYFNAGQMLVTTRPDVQSVG